MNKIEKALAKFFHALGEEKKEMQKNAETSAFMVKYIGFLELQSFPGNTAERFFAMGAAAALRAAAKPQGGKKTGSKRCAGTKPQGGKTLAKKKNPSHRHAKAYQEWEEGDDYCEEEDYE